MHDISYGTRYPAILQVNNLKTMRGWGRVDIVFERVGYTEDDVLESSVYVYVGREGEHRNFVPDTAPYGTSISATDSAGNTRYIMDSVPDTKPDNVELPSGVSWADVKTWYNNNWSDRFGAGSGGCSSKYESCLIGPSVPKKTSDNRIERSGDYDCWRKVVRLKDDEAVEYSVETGSELARTGATRRRSSVFKNLNFANAGSTDVDKNNSAKIIYSARNLESIKKIDGTEAFKVTGDDYVSAIQGNKSVCYFELDLRDIFKARLEDIDWIGTKVLHDATQQGVSYYGTGQIQISTKDRGKVIHSVLLCKTPIFFMIQEKLKKSYAGLTNLHFVETSGGGITAYSSKNQVISDRYYRAGEKLWDSKSVSGYTPVGPNTVAGKIIRIATDLAQGSGYNPSYDTKQRGVWFTTDRGYIGRYDYWTGKQTVLRQYSGYPINAMAVNPIDGSLVFVEVVGNQTTNFLKVKSVARNGDVYTVASIDDYAKYFGKYSMSGGYSLNKIAERITGGVVSQRDQTVSGQKEKWFTFIVNKEYTITVCVYSAAASGIGKVVWADKMHYGAWHACNAFSGATKNPNAGENTRAYHASYTVNKEYGVDPNMANLYGITNGILGGVYTHGHTYLHYDDKEFQYYKLIGVLMADNTWEHKRCNGRDTGHGGKCYSCGHYWKGSSVTYLSYEYDATTGTWATNADGTARTVWKSPFSVGWPVAGIAIRSPSNGGSTPTDSLLRSIDNSDPGDNSHFCRLRSEYDHTDDIKKLYNNMISTVGKFPKLSKADADTNRWRAGGSGGWTIGSESDSGYKGSGYDCHMSTGTIEKTVDRGDFWWRMMQSGFIYNANAASVTGFTPADNNKFPVYKADGGGADGKWCPFYMSTGVCEDNPKQIDRGGRCEFTEHGISFKSTGIPGNFEFYASDAWVEVEKGNRGYKIRHNITQNIGFGYQDYIIPDPWEGNDPVPFPTATRADLFDNVYVNGKMPVITRTVIKEKGLRCGACEDIWVIKANNIDWNSGYQDLDAGVSAGMADSWAQQHGVHWLTPSTEHTMLGLEETLEPNGSLVLDDTNRTLYQCIKGNTPVKIKYLQTYSQVSNSKDGINYRTLKTDSRLTDFGSVKVLYLDDTNGLWTSTGGSAKFKTTVYQGGAYEGLVMPSVFDDQVTNFGHNMCSHPYLEFLALQSKIRGQKITYQQYGGGRNGALQYRDSDPDTKKALCSVNPVVAELSLVQQSNSERINDDPVGMHAIKALGWCWTKTTQVHPTPIDPRARMYIIDEYVVEDNPCSGFDQCRSDESCLEDRYTREGTYDIWVTGAESTTAYLNEVVSAYRAEEDGHAIKRYLSATGKITPKDDDASNLVFKSYYVGEISDISWSVEDTEYPTTITNPKIRITDTSDAAISAAVQSYLISEYCISANGFSFQRADTPPPETNRPINGLPRSSKSFWDYTSYEPLIISGGSDEAAAVEAFEVLKMINLPPLYLSDGSTVVGNPVAFRAAGYEKMYTAHLVSVYDAGTYDIEKVELSFTQSDDTDFNQNKAWRRSKIFDHNDLSSITIRDRTLQGGEATEQQCVFLLSGLKSNQAKQATLNRSYQAIYNYFTDTFCVSADVLLDGEGSYWDSVNVYGKPIAYTPLDTVSKDKTYAGHPLSSQQGQLCPRMWYGTEVYRQRYYASDDGSETVISAFYNYTDLDNSISGISGYGTHPSVYVEKTDDKDWVAETSGVYSVFNAKGYYSSPHTVGGSVVTNEYCYIDERQAASAMRIPLSNNYIYVYERWPTERWCVHSNDNRGGLTLWGECSDWYEEES